MQSHHRHSLLSFKSLCLHTFRWRSIIWLVNIFDVHIWTGWGVVLSHRSRTLAKERGFIIGHKLRTVRDCSLPFVKRRVSMPARTLLHASLWGSELVVCLHSVNGCDWSNPSGREGLLPHDCVVCCDRLGEFACYGWLHNWLLCILLLLL